MAGTGSEPRSSYLGPTLTQTWGQFAHSLPRGQGQSKGNEQLGFEEKSIHRHKGGLLSEMSSAEGSREVKYKHAAGLLFEFSKETRPILSK